MTLIAVFAANAYLWYSGEKAKEEAPAKAEKKQIEDEKNNKVAEESLWFNRFGVPTRPNRSLQNFMTFLEAEAMMEKIFDYTSFDGTVAIYEDYQKGLDGVATE